MKLIVLIAVFVSSFSIANNGNFVQILSRVKYVRSVLQSGQPVNESTRIMLIGLLDNANAAMIHEDMRRGIFGVGLDVADLFYQLGDLARAETVLTQTNNHIAMQFEMGIITADYARRFYNRLLRSDVTFAINSEEEPEMMDSVLAGLERVLLDRSQLRNPITLQRLIEVARWHEVLNNPIAAQRLRTEADRVASAQRVSLGRSSVSVH